MVKWLQEKVLQKTLMFVLLPDAASYTGVISNVHKVCILISGLSSRGRTANLVCCIPSGALEQL